MLVEPYNNDVAIPTGLEIAFRYDNDELFIDARQLWEFLEIETVFANWITRRIDQYSFREGKDFFPNLEKNKGGAQGRNSKEYSLTPHMTKELCMVENNEKGKQARIYFIAIEERALAIGLSNQESTRGHIDRIYRETLNVMAQLGSGLQRGFKETNGRIQEVSEKVDENTHAIGNLSDKIVKRKAFSRKTTRIHMAVVAEFFGHRCPQCNRFVILERLGQLKKGVAEKDHWLSKDNANLTATWIICNECNRRKEHSLDLGEMETQFKAYQLQVKRYLGRQTSFFE